VILTENKKKVISWKLSTFLISEDKSMSPLSSIVQRLPSEQTDLVFLLEMLSLKLTNKRRILRKIIQDEQVAIQA
jgi:hypothetical protein